MKKQVKQFFSTLLLSALLIESPVTAYGWTPDNIFTDYQEDNSIETPTPVALTEANFPDSNFRKYLRDTYDENIDSILDAEELSAITTLDVSGMAIQTLEGISYFTALTALDCSYNRLSTLDDIPLDILTSYNADHNAYLDTDVEAFIPPNADSLSLNSLSANTALPGYSELFTERLPDETSENTIIGLKSAQSFSPVADLKKAIPDKTFRDYIRTYYDTDKDNSLSETELANVTIINVSDYEITDLTGLSLFTNLVYIDCSYTDITTVDFTGNPYLLEADLQGTLVTNADISKNSYLKAVYFSDSVWTGTISENSVSANTVSENSVSSNTVSGNSVSENSVSMNSLSENVVTQSINSANTVSGNSISGNSDFVPFDYGNTASGNLLSENTVSETTVTDNMSNQYGTTASGNSYYEPEQASSPVQTSEPPEETTKAIVLSAPTLLTAKNQSKGKVTLAYTAVSNATGYEIEYSQKNSFKKGVVTVTSEKTATSLTNFPKKKTYYFRVRAYHQATDGTITYGGYSNIIKVRIQKGVTESKYSNKAGKITACKISKTANFTFKATVKKRIASNDDYYYLCQVDPYTNKKTKVISKVGKTTKISITLPATNDKGTNMMLGKYALFIKSKGKFKIITNASYVTNPKDAAEYTQPFPTAASKKGIQGADGQSDLGVSHSLINIPLTDVISTDNTGVPYKYNGKTYYFKPQPYVGTIQRCNEAGITISAVFLLPWDEGLKSLITPKGRIPGAAHYYAWNTGNKASRETFEAAFMYLAELYSKENCHLDNWILGNEVNVPNPWNFAGKTSYNNYIENYAHSFRIMYYAAVSHNKNARVYISLDHSWQGSGSVYGAKDFMSKFNKAIKAQYKKIQWNLAYHAYPVPLTNADFWNNSLATHSNDSRYVTFKNLDILTKYVKKQFGSKTRIILSEQGFTSTSGEHIQAAAVAYGYYLSEFNTMIDAYIIRSTIDNSVETAQGLKMGLMNIDGTKKAAYDVFKYMDTPDYKTYTQSALKTLGVSNWKKLVKNFKESKLKKMPRRA